MLPFDVPKAGFDHVFIRTLHHTRTDRPTLLSELRVLHQRLSSTEVYQMAVFAFLLGNILQEKISHTQERTGATMFKDM